MDEINFQNYPRGGGALRTVAFGIGETFKVLVEVELGDDGELHMDITADCPTNEEAVEASLEALELAVAALSGSEVKEALDAQLGD